MSYQPPQFGLEIIIVEDIHMTNLHKFWSESGEGILVVVLTMILALGVYLLLAYSFITTFE